MNSPVFPIFPIVALTIAFLFALIVTPLARRLALFIGLMDHPDTHRKLHREPIALCGGLAILFSMIATVAICLLTNIEFANMFSGHVYEATSLALGAVAIVLLGVLDDRFGLRGRQKLAGQVVICMSIIAFGFTIDKISIFGMPLELGLLAIPITLGWLLLSINSVNLIDGADGLCSSVGWIAFSALAAIGWYTGNHMESMIAATMAGSLLGFLIFNLPPAKVFLGDAGSMLVGLILGVLAMRSWLTEGTPISIAVPVVLMAIPLFDSGMAIVRRKLTGRSVFTVDRGHLHHNLMRFGIKNRWLVGVITLLSLVTAGGAVLGVVFQSDVISIGTMIFALGSLVATRVFGFAELELLCKRGLNFSKSIVARQGVSDHKIRKETVRLQGSREWDTVWSIMVEFAEKHALSKISLDLNMPWLHEGFHASWHKNKLPEFSERWFLRLPVVSKAKVLGRIEVIGHHKDADTYAVMSSLSEMLKELQPGIQALVDDFTAENTRPKSRKDAALVQKQRDLETVVDSPIPESLGAMTTDLSDAF
ncbi:MAG: MraY family glycosyltransferase [Planctomycetota bacterium]|nr:MraY family glycosyltransferase [Planctomycetota bacterium]